MQILPGRNRRGSSRRTNRAGPVFSRSPASPDSTGRGEKIRLKARKQVTLPPRRDFAPTLDVYAGQSHRLQQLYDDATETAIYLWGRATHERLSGDALLRHVLSISRSRESQRLREVRGHFVFILDDRPAATDYFRQ